MDRNKTHPQSLGVNPGYALFQLSKAFNTAEQHEDPNVRVRANQRIEKWTAVWNGLLNGSLNAGSRTPMSGVPSWATLEVVTGGFATGGLMAGGPLLPHERERLSSLGLPADSNDRSALNAFFLTDEGLAQLRELLRSGSFDVSVPEEGALLVVAWLLENGHAEAGRSLLDEIGPFFPQLRFYPTPAACSRFVGSRVFLQSAGATLSDLQRIKPNPRVLAQKEAIHVWHPLYDRTVALFLETVVGDPPSLTRGQEAQTPTAEAEGRRILRGGWPCQQFPPTWGDRALKLLDEYQIARTKGTRCGKPERNKESFAQLRDYLARCIVDPKSLSGRDVGRIRLILGRYVAKHGVPNSAKALERRSLQQKEVSAPTFHEIARVVSLRIARFPGDRGIEDTSSLTQPISPDEEQQSAIAAGAPIPPSIAWKIERCREDTVDSLVTRGVITSGETLARVLPQITSNLRAAGIVDPNLRRLYASIYRGFRRRRSLLLLNLQSQVRVEELPWVAAIDRFRCETLSTQQLSRQALEEVAALTIVSFPQAIIPNKLLREIRALAKGAAIEIPLVDEIAADIFMGAFSGEFLKAAKCAADLLEGSLYQRYFGIDFDQVRKIPSSADTSKFRWFRQAQTESLAQFCANRAGVALGGWDAAVNGMVIEQEQILTSQNLAALSSALELRSRLSGQLQEMTKTCFSWICKRQQVRSDNWHGRLIMVKNTAYAWRQMVFFLALAPGNGVSDFMVWAEEHFAKQTPAFKIRFRPALDGLRVAVAGRTLDDRASEPNGPRRFLGWSKRRHWLLEEIGEPDKPMPS